MKKLLQTLCFCLLVLSSGCRPDGVLSETEMTDLLADLYLTDGFIEAAGDARQVWDSLDVYGPQLEAHGVTVADFDASIEYYLRHPKEFADVFEKVQDKLEAEGQRIDDRDVEEMEDAEEVIDEKVEEVWEELDIEPGVGEVKAAKEEPAKEQKKEMKRKNGRKKLSKKELEELEKQLK